MAFLKSLVVMLSISTALGALHSEVTADIFRSGSE
jgi:hypothetical protein